MLHRQWKQIEHQVKANLWKNFINNETQVKNMHLDISQKMESMRIINSYNIHMLSNVQYLQVSINTKHWKEFKC